jgi:hypothetical protein
MPLGAFRLNGLSRFEAPTGRTAQTVSTFGNAQVDTGQSQFGGASLQLDGNGDYLRTQFSLTSARTFECWIRLNNVSGEKYVFRIHDSADNFSYVCGVLNSNLYIFAGGTTTGGTLATNTWYHIAYVDNGSTITIFFNGTSVGSRGSPGSTTNALIYLGGFTNNLGVNGWMDEIRISNIARYTSNFTPAGPFTNDSNTLLLLHCNGTDASTTFTDDAS